MAGVEASGKTIDEAVEKALSELGVERDAVDVEVLSEGRGGVLGVGASEARVRVRLLGDTDDAAAATGPSLGGAGEAPADGEGEVIEDDAEFAAQMLDKLLAMMGVRADVSIRDPETPGDGLGMAQAVLDIEGEELGLLIGRRGETLTSLQYLLNLMVARQVTNRAFFTVDVEGYRQRRERALTTLARRTADTVKRTRRPVILEPMPPNERRMIHIALSEDRLVETSSVGEGDDRKVSVSLRR